MGFAWGLWLRLGLVWRRLEGNGSHGRWIVVGWVLIPGSFRSWMALGRGSWRLILVGLGLNRCWLGLNPWWVLLWCGFCFGVGFASICCWLGLNWWWVLLWCGFCFDWVLAGFCFSDGFCFDYFDGFCFGVGSGGWCWFSGGFVVQWCLVFQWWQWVVPWWLGGRSKAEEVFWLMRCW